MIYFFKRKISPGFKVNKKDLVIDIGSGDKPFWRGDVFFDDLGQSDNQRISASKVINDLGVFVNGVIEKAPFKDKAFDFSFCAHLLEHTERPELAIKELERISKKGYIEVPNGLHESIAPYRSHLWFIYLSGKKLVFVRKSKKMSDTLINNGKSYRYLLYLMIDPFIRLHWKNNIEYEIIDDLKKLEKFYPKNEKHIKSFSNTQGIYLVIIKILRKLFYQEKDHANLMKLIRPQQK
ncbi:class I SAM-dependent methyltransferase [Candidatus Parcubacteria bacterium]|nr:MAG: class I SAM-dependent methyltransferase [Candidatus Parcubacteria bacterium]